MKKPILILAMLAALLTPAVAGAQDVSVAPLTVSITGATVSEGDGVMPFTFTLSGVSDSDVKIRVQAKTHKREAFAKTDFVKTRGTIVIPAGETSATFNVELIDDDIAEGPERMRLKIKWVRGAKFKAPPRPRGTIIDDDSDIEPAGDTAFELKVLHVNDTHSHLEPASTDLSFAGKDTRIELGGFSRVITKINELKDSSETPVVTISAGDAISGTLFYSQFKGQATAAMMNQVCFDIFELGNHEFDDGDESLAVFLNNIGGIYNPHSAACRTTILGANVKPAQGTPLYPNDDPEQFIKPFTIKTYGDDQVGFVGLDIAGKTRNSSSPLDTTEFLDEVETAQTYVDELTAQGIDKIVLVTHIQFVNDLDVASKVVGVDAIIGGDSHTLLGDFADFGLNEQGEYPTFTTDPAGNTVCIVQAWEYSAIVGELNIGWDDQGRISSCNGVPHLLVGDSFLRRPEADADRAPIEGDDLTEVLDIIAANPQISIVQPDVNGDATLEFFAAQIEALGNTVIGTVTEDLCLERIPGQGRSNLCDVSATAEHGGDIQQAVTHAFWNRSFEADIAIQNSGGVRIDVPAGPLTIADAYTVLPFANTLVNLEMTGTEIAQVLEEAAEFALADSTGAYPYASGLRWSVDLSQPNGERFSNLEVKAKGGSEWTPLDLAATYTVVTNSFVAGGRDGYITFGTVSDDGRVVDTFLDYAKSFIDYVQQDLAGVLPKIPTDEYSTQNFIPAPAG